MAINKINSKSIEDLQISADDLANGTVTNAKLANTTITINGTSIDLGSSGDIVAGTDWQAVVVADGSTSTTAVAGEGYFIDTTSNTHTINLPSSPSAGDTVAIKDYAATFGTNNLTIGRNGNNIQGVANDSLISTNRASIILVYSDATKGWLYTVESNVADLEVPSFISATGGTVTTSGDYKIHTFTGDGCFVVSSLGNNIPCAQASTVDYLVVAGGAAGGGHCASGGGGAGGYRESSGTTHGCYTVSPLGACVSALPVSATTYPVTVGAGGSNAAQGPYSNPPCTNNGNPSVFSTITSAQGGGGGNYNSDVSPPTKNGAGGGSGGGGATTNNTPGLFPSGGAGGSGNNPPVSPPQGNPGGAGRLSNSPGTAIFAAAGGGGATAAGTSSAPGAGGGPGGAGATSSITGTPITRGGGGGGSSCGPGPAPGATQGLGGSGGGGNGGMPGVTGPLGPGVAGTANTGGGGGGGRDTKGGNGGKGIVIIRYKYQ